MFYQPRPLFPEPALPAETGMLTEPGALTETSDPPLLELLPDPLPAPAVLPVLLPEPVLSTETRRGRLATVPEAAAAVLPAASVTVLVAPVPKATAAPPVTAPTAYQNTLRASTHQPFMPVTLIHAQL